MKSNKGTKMLAYNSDTKLRTAMLKEIKSHYEQDQIIKGTYGQQNGKWEGCAVGCSIHSLNKIQGKNFNTSDHAVSETIGIPQSLYRLQDSIFENLQHGEYQSFPGEFASAIKAGADLSKVTANFIIWTLLDPKHGCINNAPKDKFADCYNAIIAAAAVWQKYVKTGKIDVEAAWSAAESAKSAAESAAWSAAESAWSAAWSAAESAAESAKSAAWSAAESAAWSAAESAAKSAAESAAWSAAESAKSAAKSAAESAAESAWSAAESAAARTKWWQAAKKELLRLLKAAK